MQVKVLPLGRIWVISVAVSFAKTGISALYPQFGFLTLSDPTTKIDRFPLRIEFAGKALIALTANAPFVAMADDILVFASRHFRFPFGCELGY
jgi:hypothetical protein